MAKAIKNAIIATVVVVAVMYGASVLLTTFGGTAGAAAAATLSKGILMAAATTFVGSLVSSAMGAMFNEGFNSNNANLGTKTTTRQSIAPRQIVYGTCRTGGVIAHIETTGTNNHKLCILSVVSGHPIAGFVSVRFGDTTVTTSSSTISGETVFRVTNSDFVNSDNENAFTGGSLARFTFHDGTQTARDGLAAATLGSTSIPTTHKYTDCAYFYFEFIFDSEAMSSIPPISYTLKGKNVFDPRTNAAATTDLQRENPALQIRDYLTDTVYGMRAESSEINDTTNAGGFAAAANTCDQNVTLADGSSTEKRYKASGFSTFSASGESIINGLQSAMAARLTYTNGQFNIFAGAAQTPTLTITDDDLLAPIQIDTGSGSSRGQLFNQVKAIFVDASNSFKTDETPILSDTTMLSQDTPSGSSSNNFRKTLEAQLPFTTSNTMAQRIGKIQLKYQRKTMSVQVNVGMKFIRLQPNDFVYITNERLGFNQKMFEVQTTGMSLDDDGSGALAASINLSLLEISADVWDFATNEYTTAIGEGSVINTGSFAQAAPTIGTLVQRATIQGPHTIIDIIVPWTNQQGDAVQGTEVQYKLSSESDFAVATVAGKGQTKAAIQNVVVGSTYNVRLRHFTFDNVYSSVSSVANITIAEADTLAQPSSVSATTGKPFFIELKWTNPSNTNLRAVEVHASTTTGFTPSSGTLVNTYYGDVGKNKRVVLGKSSAFGFDYDTTFFFRLRAINALGTATAFTSEVSGSFTKALSADIDSITANQISAGTIDASQITVENIDAAEIASGGTITGVDLVIGSGTSVFKATTSGLQLGNDTFGSAPFRVTPQGALTSTSGSIGGFTIGPTDLVAGSNATRVSLSTSDGIHLGNNTFSNAPFRVTLAGALTSTSGAIGGFTIGNTSLIAGANTTRVSLSTADGIHLGDNTFSSAPFRVDRAGNLTATSVTVTGSVTATSGRTGPITTNDTKLFLGTGTFNNSNTGFYVDENGQFSLKDKLVFDGTDLTVSGGITATTLSLTNSSQGTIATALGGTNTAGASGALTDGASATTLYNDNGVLKVRSGSLSGVNHIVQESTLVKRFSNDKDFIFFQAGSGFTEIADLWYKLDDFGGPVQADDVVIVRAGANAYLASSTGANIANSTTAGIYSAKCTLQLGTAVPETSAGFTAYGGKVNNTSIENDNRGHSNFFSSPRGIEGMRYELRLNSSGIGSTAGDGSSATSSYYRANSINGTSAANEPDSSNNEGMDKRIHLLGRGVSRLEMVDSIKSADAQTEDTKSHHGSGGRYNGLRTGSNYAYFRLWVDVAVRGGSSMRFIDPYIEVTIVRNSNDQAAS